MKNLFTAIPDDLSSELLETLFEAGSFRVERIVSNGQASPPGFWYDQNQAEWVVVLQGAARLRLANQEHLIELQTGDWVNIDAHVKHRVEWTTPDGPTIWLAIHYQGQ